MAMAMGEQSGRTEEARSIKIREGDRAQWQHQLKYPETFGF